MKKPGLDKIKWVLGELDVLEQGGLINAAHSRRLKDHYTERLGEYNPQKTIFVFISILSALLVTGGCILLFGYNWEVLGQLTKTFLVVALLLLSQGSALYLLLQKKRNIGLAAKEAISFINAAAFGAVMAIIGQIYNLESNITAFLAIWCASTLLLIYIFDSLACVALYLVLAICLITQTQNDGGVGFYFFFMLAALVPHYLSSAGRQTQERTTLYNYFLIAASLVGLGISFEKNIPGLWIIAYANLLCIYYLSGELFENKGRLSLFHSPLSVTGVIGIALLAFLFSWQWPWEEIGWNYYRNAERFHKFASSYDYIVCVISTIVSTIMALAAFRKKISAFNPVLLFFPALVIVFYLVNSFMEYPVISTWGMNLFILLLCGYGFILGYRKRSVLLINLSMLFLTLTIVSRFFDESMSLLGRGFVFIICGAVMFVVNFKFVRNLKVEQ